MLASSAKFATGLMLIAAKAAFAYKCETVTSSTTIQPKTLAVQRDQPVGSLIAQVKSGTVEAYKCFNTAPTLTWQGKGIRAVGTYVGHFDGKRVYKTNVKGIGYALGVRSLDVCNTGQTLWVDASSSMHQADRRLYCEGNGFLGTHMSAVAVINFYKTESTTGTGTVSGQQVGTFVLGNNDSWHSPQSTISFSSFTVEAVSCTVSNTLIPVKLGDVPISAFKGPGTSPPSRTQAFSIPLNCAKGTSINVQLDGAAHDAAQGMLKLDAGSTSATGVAIQLLYDDKPVELAKRFKWQVADADGDYAIPLKARYVQTANSVTTGVANGSATFTLTYQ